jgi:hypothetical protein
VSALEPGLYRWSFGGKSYDGIMDCDGDFSYLSSDGRHCTRGHGYTTDARPLIVLDTNPVSVKVIASILRASGYRRIADDIEAQTKPARIPEPKHIGSLVTASASSINGVCVWTRYAETGRNIWITPLGIRRAWSELIDPEPFPFGGKS